MLWLQTPPVVCRSGSYQGPGPRRLRAVLPDVLTMLHNMAVDPTSDEWSIMTAEGAAWLSFRELVWPLKCLTDQ